jgi:release factor glutamine methyltransferase
MSASPAVVSLVVARLRAAGCVFAEDEAVLLLGAARAPAELDALVDRRVAGLPLEHVLGWAEFCGLRIAVDLGVFVPRRRTEFLVREAAALIGTDGSQRANPAVVVELCCGSGAVGAALARLSGRIELHAADIDPAAVSCARRNLAAAAGRVYQGDLFEPLPAALRGQVDLLVANVPYVPSAAVELMPPEARVHEPLVALDGGPDGLDVLRRVSAEAPRWLSRDGYLLVETSEGQSGQAVEIVRHDGLAADVARSDDLGATVIVATRSARSAQAPVDQSPKNSVSVDAMTLGVSFLA